jgi:hypothetical protein
MSHEDTKERKKAQLKKNRYHQMLFGFVRQRRADEERVKSLEEKLKPPTSEKPSSEVGDKVASIRNRLTGQKRLSRERWNRFAGTSGGGGRGL